VPDIAASVALELYDDSGGHAELRADCVLPSEFVGTGRTARASETHLALVHVKEVVKGTTVGNGGVGIGSEVVIERDVFLEDDDNVLDRGAVRSS